MKRMRMLAMFSGFVALAFPALANAQTTTATPSATGGEKYGGASVGEDMGTQQSASPAESDTSPTGIDTSVHAVDETPTAVATPVVVDNNVQVIENRNHHSKMGLAISAGGGVTNFTDGQTAAMTSVGGAWDARLAIGTRSILGLEAAYVGSASEINSLGLDNNAMLVGNGVEGLARVNLGTYAIQPYAVGGAGWTHYAIANNSVNTSSVSNSDDVLAVPVGGGLSTYIGPGVLVDARFTYRWTFDNNMMTRDALGNRSDLDNWSATGRVGFEF